MFVFVTGRHQNLQAEVVRLSERETSMQNENQHLQEKIILLEKVSHIPVLAAGDSESEEREILTCNTMFSVILFLMAA